MGQVIYLTGAPASGKSTLCEHLEKVVPNLRVYSYSKLLRDYVNRQNGTDINEVSIRQHSANVITRADVEAVDQLLIEQVRLNRADQNIIIDSHPVTKEDYGFRVTAFTQEQLRQLNPDVIICLYVAPEVARQRITGNAAGRPLPLDFELALHAELQASLATQYAFVLGKPCYLLDSSVALDDLIKNILRIAKIT
jgi:adenylate kinase